ncbi:hypothetical protein WICPIJ_004191 [Wickerhamomyces pijperi]|uniref:TECPR1-like DysF domain-containing protein n=1 Tax=Wickerhamomyces pijperi TaxID=599730 RepID=A0A9P8Q645_WICPI|nr:hypothetical protein WICPIJ_004191 [Wickerhamomyces pijperi]
MMSSQREYKKSNVLGLVQENLSSFFADSGHTSQPKEGPDEVKALGDSGTLFNKQPNETSASDSTQQSNFMMDKIIERFITMALPATNEETSTARIQRRIDQMECRPSLSVQLMSRNFIQLNSRLSLPFEFINEVLNFLSWKTPSLTLTWLVVITNLIICPSYVVTVSLLVFILIPMSRSFYDIYQPLSDPKLNPGPLSELSPFPVRNPHFVKPPTEFTREFLINVTDLQNHMLIYIHVWNFVTFKLINRYGNFSNELVSSVLFVSLLSFSLLLYVFGDFARIALPFMKALGIVSLWLVVYSFHPNNKDFILDFLLSEELRIKLQKSTNDLERALNSEFVFDQPSGDMVYEIEIFEIQMLDEETNEWKFSRFSDDPLTSKSLPRLAHTESYVHNISKVNPPDNFQFSANSKWNIDLQSPEVWLQDHLIDANGVRFDVDTKWVYDAEVEDEGQTFRRRRWIRTVIGFIGCSSEEETGEDSAELKSEDVSVPPEDESV